MCASLGYLGWHCLAQGRGTCPGMLALLSSPVRSWILTVLLVLVVAFVLMWLSRLLQRRDDGEPTRVSHAMSSASDFLRRRTRTGADVHASS